jgi:hypothetical protein
MKPGSKKTGPKTISYKSKVADLPKGVPTVLTNAGTGSQVEPTTRYCTGNLKK